MLEVENLVKKYGGFYALNNLNFSISEGEIVGFLGPNGAGKSTTMNIITGYLSSTSGTVKIDGHEVLEDPLEIKKKIGYLPEVPPLYLDMTVKEYLNFVFDLKKVKLERKKHIEETCGIVKIMDVQNRIIKTLSKGYKQRVGIAQALIGDPKLLIFDEPTVGLDPQQIIEIRNLIKTLGENHTIILSSHILPEIQATCNRVIIINRGKIVTDEKMDELETRMYEENKFILSVEDKDQKAFNIIKDTKCVLNIKKLSEDNFMIEFSNGLQGRRNVFKSLADNGLPILSLKGASLTLEDMFLEIIGDSKPQIENDFENVKNDEGEDK